MKDLEKNLENGCSPADCLINKYKLNWDKSVMPIYEEMIFDEQQNCNSDG